LAGAEGFEPPKAVLETAGLPLAYAPQQPANFSLLYFLVRLMLTAKRAEFVELQPFGFGLLIFGLAIVLPLALSALQSNNFAHCCSLLFSRENPRIRGIHEVEEVGKRRPSATFFLDFLNS
jgi:hypothetical protein